MKNILIIIVISLGCNFPQKENLIQSNYSVRLIGNKHSLVLSGIIASRGLRVTNDKDLTEEINVSSYNTEVYRNGEKVFILKNNGSNYSNELMEFISNEINELDSLVFKEIRTVPQNDEIEELHYSYVHKK